MVFCSKCGSKNTDGSAYCYNCGTKLMTVIPDWKGIAEPSIAGKDPTPRADERATMNEAVRPPCDGTPVAIPAGYGLPPIKPNKSRTSLIVATLIVGVVIIMASTLLFLMPLSTSFNNTSNPVVVNGSYSNYRAVLVNGSTSVDGNGTISYLNVTSTSMTMTTSILINGKLTSVSQNMVLVNHVWEADDISATSSTDSWQANDISATSTNNSTTFTNFGVETIPTVFGDRICDHTRTITSSYTEDDWSVSVCFMKSVVTLPNGPTYTMTITDTNIEGI